MRSLLAACVLWSIPLVANAGPPKGGAPPVKAAAAPAKPAVAPAKAPAPAKAAAPAKATPSKAALHATGKLARKPGAMAPLPAGSPHKSMHGPYSEGECDLCHQRKDARNPGPLLKAVNDLCIDCHEDYKAVTERTAKHAPVVEACTNCHNAHSSRERALLLDEAGNLCMGCHDKIKDEATKSEHRHDAVTKGDKCLGCHNPHSSNVEKLLKKLAFDLCIDCHGKDGLLDDKGRKLTNFKKLLAENPVHHSPVGSKDCSACHKVHGSPNFRLLTLYYPAEFYAPYDPKNYALCFDCHQDDLVKTKETTSLTGFRDGSRNLHFLHVNKDEKGRTCRACHEVHASKQPYQVRDGVPYGKKAWMLRLHYNKKNDGGSCEKTCHSTKPYKNASAKAAAPSAKR